jgi:hypothetical protein
MKENHDHAVDEPGPFIASTPTDLGAANGGVRGALSVTLSNG